MSAQGNVLAVVGVFSILLALAYCVRPTPPSVDDAWVINLDKDKERLGQFLRDAQVLNQTVQRWPATYGKDVERTDAEDEGIHPSLTGPDNMKDRHKTTKIIRRPGEYGCWLSHKRLLQHLATLPVSASHGHLILEDDCEIPSDFPLRWSQVRQEVPSDWDMVFLGIHNVHGTRVSDHVLRYQHGRQGGGNWGTHGYLVRHGAIPGILQTLEYYHAPIDVQYYRTLQHKKIYILDPTLVKQREGVVSNIVS
jgi:GR25 family glycosyltransferase involved in LPS biosynthesis